MLHLQVVSGLVEERSKVVIRIILVKTTLHYGSDSRIPEKVPRELTSRPEQRQTSTRSSGS